ncbi:hypothetical protein EF384_01080 [Aerococcus agrisoli]|uniref:Uncharacterized protein n=1 Tax=Aerococcus agrisoli TaxID=2487350 RepID=A0A3N4HEZ2_9LACT|nr:hypothetical protein [Aerococcus agrisoli]RPA65034.1 hypothetical protein EF384_01080 [Aerococcus agrisoli]
MALNAQKTTFIISRIKNGVEEVAQYNDYNGTIYWYSNPDSATDFEDLELAKGMLQVQDMMAKLTKQDVTFKLYQLDAETYEINTDGERVLVEEETPTEETA